MVWKTWLQTKHFSIETNLANCLIGIETMPIYEDDELVGSALRIGIGFLELVIY